MDRLATIRDKGDELKDKAQKAFDDWTHKESGLWQRMRKAWRARKELLANPEDTEKVFEVIDALRGNSLQRAFEKFKITPTGKQVLENKLNILPVLQDREQLATYEKDSLAAEYLRFVSSESLTADGLVMASVDATKTIENLQVLLYAERMRDTHDLWHTLTRYGRDPLGEACLLAFTYAQTRNTAIAFIVVTSLIKLQKGYGAGSIQALWRAYIDGRRASWLPAQMWEETLPLNIHNLRVMLSIKEPSAYWNVLASHKLQHA